MGGKPSRSTPADQRLKSNKSKPKPSSKGNAPKKGK